MIDFTPVYILILVFSLIAVVLLVFFVRKNKKQQRLSPLAGVAFAFVVAAIIFSGEGRALGYSLTGIGIVIALIDIVLKLKKK